MGLEPTPPLPPSPLEHAPIEWIYLSYSTSLPSAPAGPHAPPAPNLAAYANPLDWPTARKLTLLWISTIATALTAMGAGMYAPPIGQMTVYFGISRVDAAVGITVFTLGFAIAPMVLAPFSEIAGRRPIFVATGALWLIMQLCCAVTRAFSGMLVARFLAGCASSTFSTMVGGVVSDMYRGHNRNMPMTVFTGGVLFGTGLGPLVGGFIAQHVDWRWVFYVHAIAVGVLLVFIFFFFYESRGSVLLSRKARALNAHYDACERAGLYGVIFDSATPPRRVRWKCADDEERSTLAHMVRVSVQRPFVLLFTEPVVAAFSLFVSFSWAVLYMTFSAVPYIFQTTYGFNLESANAIFAATIVASIIWTVVSIQQERFAARRGWLKPGPEQRLIFACYEALCLPIGLFWLGWSGAFPSVHWIVPALGVALSTIGIFQIYLCTFNYLADAYVLYASSAIAAQSFCRNVLGGAFPLFTEQMFERLTIGGAGSLLGGIGLVLSMIPWVLKFYGPAIRQRSKICGKMMAETG